MRKLAATILVLVSSGIGAAAAKPADQPRTMDEVVDRVVVNENGRRRSITKQEAMVKHLVNKALSGDRRLIQLMLEEIRLLENRAASSTTAVIDEADQQVMRQLQERLRCAMPGGGDGFDIPTDAR